MFDAAALLPSTCQYEIDIMLSAEVALCLYECKVIQSLLFKLNLISLRNVDYFNQCGGEGIRESSEKRLRLRKRAYEVTQPCFQNKFSHERDGGCENEKEIPPCVQGDEPTLKDFFTI